MAKYTNVVNMALTVTNKCNIDCAHCLKGEKDNTTITDEIIKRSFEGIDMVDNLTICGGEPTLAVEQINKIIDYIINNKIIVNTFGVVINGTIYSEEFLKALERMNDYIHLYNKDGGALFSISYDKYHVQEVKKRNMVEEYANNLIKYESSPYFVGFQTLGKGDDLIREGNAVNLDESITRPLEPLQVVNTFVGKKVLGIFPTYDEEGIENIGTFISISPEGIITDCNASIVSQRTTYNFGNVLDETIPEYVKRCGITVKPIKFQKIINKDIKKQLTYKR